MGTYLRIILFCFISSSPICFYESVKADDSSSKCILRPSLDEFRAYALHNSPLIAEIDVAYSEELARAFDNSVLANPELQVEQTFTGMKLGGDNDGQSNVSLAQPFKLSNFGSREKVSNLIKEAGDIQKQIALLELTQNLNLQYRTLRILQETEVILNSAKTRSNKKVDLIKDGVKKGLFSLGEEKLFEAETALLEAQQRGLDAQVSEYKAEVGRSLGSSCEIQIPGNRESLTDLPSENVLLEKARSSKMSENSRLKVLSKLATEKAGMAKLDAFPSLSPRFVYQHTNDSGDFYGAGISIPLPLWNRNQGEILKSSSEVDFLQQKQIFLDQGGLRGQIKLLLNSATSSRDQSVIYSKKVIPNFKMALDIQEQIYNQGKGNILQVWQMQRAFYEAQMQELKLWLETLKSRINLSILVGEEL